MSTRGLCDVHSIAASMQLPILKLVQNNKIGLVMSIKQVFNSEIVWLVYFREVLVEMGSRGRMQVYMWMCFE